jgi:hypothetical protein
MALDAEILMVLLTFLNGAAKVLLVTNESNLMGNKSAHLLQWRTSLTT